MARPSRSLVARRLVPSFDLARVLGLAGLVAVAGVGRPAAASPAQEACAGKSEGEACGMMKLVKPEGGGELQRTTVPGVCRADECCDLDYSKGSPPETVCHACLACKDGPADVAPAPAKADDPPPSAAGEAPRTEGGPPPTGPSEQRGCAVGGHPRAAAGWLGALALLAGARRRRR